MALSNDSRSRCTAHRAPRVCLPGRCNSTLQSDHWYLNILISSPQKNRMITLGHPGGHILSSGFVLYWSDSDRRRTSLSKITIEFVVLFPRTQKVGAHTAYHGEIYCSGFRFNKYETSAKNNVKTILPPAWFVYTTQFRGRKKKQNISSKSDI